MQRSTAKMVFPTLVMPDIANRESASQLHTANNGSHQPRAAQWGESAPERPRIPTRTAAAAQRQGRTRCESCADDAVASDKDRGLATSAGARVFEELSGETVAAGERVTLRETGMETEARQGQFGDAVPVWFVLAMVWAVCVLWMLARKGDSRAKKEKTMEGEERLEYYGQVWK